MFEIRATEMSGPDEITCESNSAYSCLLVSWVEDKQDTWQRMVGCCGEVTQQIFFESEISISFFSQTIDAFYIPFEPQSYL